MGNCRSRLRKRLELQRGTDLDKIQLMIGLYFQESMVLLSFFWLSFPYIGSSVVGGHTIFLMLFSFTPGQCRDALCLQTERTHTGRAMRGFVESRNHDGKGSRVDVEQMNGVQGGSDHCGMELERVEEPSKSANNASITGLLMLQLGNSYHYQDIRLNDRLTLENVQS